MWVLGQTCIMWQNVLWLSSLKVPQKVPFVIIAIQHFAKNCKQATEVPLLETSDHPQYS